jgi:D-alanyl-D-alanine carboxypeptidase
VQNSTGHEFYTMNAKSYTLLDQLYTPLKIRAQQHWQLLSNKGIEIEFSQGFRNWPQQETLYAEGRTTPGPIVTHARGGESWHNYGLAYDIVIVTAHGLDWTGTDELWLAVIDTGESLGLRAGAEWHGANTDRPHFQLTGEWGDSPDEGVLSLFKGGGIFAVWAELDKFYGIVK